jgi:hypothetical protein
MEEFQFIKYLIIGLVISNLFIVLAINILPITASQTAFNTALNSSGFLAYDNVISQQLNLSAISDFSSCNGDWFCLAGKNIYFFLSVIYRIFVIIGSILTIIIITMVSYLTLILLLPQLFNSVNLGVFGVILTVIDTGLIVGLAIYSGLYLYKLFRGLK